MAIPKEGFSGIVDRVGLTLPGTWEVLGVDVGAGLNNHKRRRKREEYRLASKQTLYLFPVESRKVVQKIPGYALHRAFR